jgi:outer membrane protein assembly factor BamB
LVFKLAPGSGGQWSETILRSFSVSGNDGYSPNGPTFGAAGNLYVATGSGGSTGCSGYGCGVLVEFSPTSGGQWTETLVHTFTGKPGDGISSSPVLFGRTGNIYGASGGGTANEGVIYELIP